MESVFQFQKSVENKIVELEVVAEANSAAQQNSLAAALDPFEGIGMCVVLTMSFLWLKIGSSLGRFYPKAAN